MAKNRRGGYRQPAKPAPVATPQGGQRTDGGPGSSKQPLRDMPGLPYGQQQQLLNQQKAAPLPAERNIQPRPTSQQQPQDQMCLHHLKDLLKFLHQEHL